MPTEAVLMVVTAMVTPECTTKARALELESTLEPMETMAMEAKVAMVELLVCLPPSHQSAACMHELYWLLHCVMIVLAFSCIEDDWTCNHELGSTQHAVKQCLNCPKDLDC